jgi:Protein kinase domain
MGGVERGVDDIAIATTVAKDTTIGEDIRRFARVETGMLLPPGTRVGRYEIVRQLGAGGMGVVYEAADRELARTIALKLVRPRGVALHDAQRRVQREAQAMARLPTASGVVVHEIGTHGELVFIAMELVAGGTLRGWMATPRGWRACVAMFVPVGRRLAAAHEAGIVHRDFKPENVLLGARHEIRIADFGLARAMGAAAPLAAADAPITDAGASATDPSRFDGTPAYMPPEQWRGEAADARSDQFSFAVAFYEALEGARPYLPVADDGRVLRPWSARTPRWLRAIVERALAYDPARRWGSLAAMLDAIERAQRRRRRAWIAAGGAVAIGCAIAATSYLAAPARPAPPALVWQPALVASFTLDEARPAAMSWDDRSILYVKDREYRIQRRGTVDEIRRTLPDQVTAGDWELSPDGTEVYVSAAHSDGGVTTFEIWRLDATGSPRLVVRPPVHQLPIISPDGRRLLLVDGPDPEAATTAPARVIDLATGAERELPRARSVTAAAWAPDSERVALVVHGDPEQVAIVDARSGAAIATLPGGDREIDAIAWSGRSTLVLASNRGTRSGVEAWTLEADARLGAVEDVYRAPPLSRVIALSATRDALYAMIASTPYRLHQLALDASHAVTRVDTRVPQYFPPVGWTARGELVFSTPGDPEVTLALPPTGGAPRTIATGAHPVVVLGDDVWILRRAGEQRFTLERSGDRAAAPLAIAGHAASVVCAGDRRPPCLVAVRRQPLGDLSLFRWTPGGTSLGAPIATIALDEDRAFALSADGATLAIARSGSIELLDLATGRSTQVARDPAASYFYPAWGSDGALYVSLAIDDRRDCRIAKVSGERAVVLHDEPGCAAMLSEIRIRPDQQALVFRRQSFSFELYRVPLAP